MTHNSIVSDIILFDAIAYVINYSNNNYDNHRPYYHFIQFHSDFHFIKDVK